MGRFVDTFAAPPHLLPLWLGQREKRNPTRANKEVISGFVNGLQSAATDVIVVSVDSDQMIHKGPSAIISTANNFKVSGSHTYLLDIENNKFCFIKIFLIQLMCLANR